MTLKLGYCIKKSFIKKSMSVNSDSLNFFRTIFLISKQCKKVQLGLKGLLRNHNQESETEPPIGTSCEPQ